MNFDRILVIGGHKSTFRSSAIVGTTNFDEFSVIIWSPSQSILELQNTSELQVVSSHVSKLVDWVSHGHLLIILSVPIVPFNLIDKGKVVAYRVDESALFSGVSFQPATGELIEFCGERSLLPLFKNSIPSLHYEVILKSQKLSPLLRVSRGRQGGDQLVAGFTRLGSGYVIFAPPLKSELQHLALAYYSSLATFQELLTVPPVVVPEWAYEFRTHEEDQTLKRIEQFQENIASLQAQITELDTTVRSELSLKQLFVGTGDPFADAVQSALTELGLTCVKGPHYRADLIGYDGKQLAAIESKGLDGGAREGNLRQTERWVADVKFALVATEDERAADPDLKDYAAKLADVGVSLGADPVDIDCKGIMVIGTHRKTPLGERREPSFSDPVARTINRSAVCALSGLQLLGLLLRARKDPAIKPTIVKLLFSTNGVLAEAVDWSEFLIKRQ